MSNAEKITPMSKCVWHILEQEHVEDLENTLSSITDCEKEPAFATARS
jgi:hypothetical protein